MIGNLVSEFSRTYIDDRAASNTVSKAERSYELLIEQIPESIRQIGVLPQNYVIKGSVGQGNKSETPWIGFFDPDISVSAQTGYYIVGLFSADLKRLYISLNQGWTQYQDRFGAKKGRSIIEQVSLQASNVLRPKSDFATGQIDLLATRSLGKGYELGNIYAVEYPVNNMPDEAQFGQDLTELIQAFKYLKSIVGDSLLNIRSVVSEDSFQDAALEEPPKDIGLGPVDKKQPSEASTGRRWPRDPAIASSALELAHYQCKVDSTHLTFTSKRNGKPFVEAHHLIPMEFQDEFTYSLDVPENIIALCP